ncbi:MAG TPA: deoxyribonuclease IV [Chthonomonadales bacterium]|nr:deoxyribonuclease IV [Chthonomonadales bacterium]
MPPIPEESGGIDIAAGAVPRRVRAYRPGILKERMNDLPGSTQPEGERLLGAHMPCVGGLASSLYAGRRIGCDAVQLFTGSPRQWSVPALEDEAIEAFHAARIESGVRFTVAHDSYLINLAAPDAHILDRSRKALSRELDRANALGIPWVVTHLGAHLQSGEEQGLDRLVESIRLELDRSEGLATGIALETTAGQGTALGWRFEHIARVFDAVGDHPRLSACLDTCHVFAAGYDLRTPEAYHATVAEFDRVVGLRRLSVIHANDARKPLGSRVDRHEHLGDGEIGIEAFALLARDARLWHVPIIVETPESETMHEVNLGRLRVLSKVGGLGIRAQVLPPPSHEEVDADASRGWIEGEQTAPAAG